MTDKPTELDELRSAAAAALKPDTSGLLATFEAAVRQDAKAEAWNEGFEAHSDWFADHSFLEAERPANPYRNT